MKSAQQLKFEQAEQEYEVVRLAVKAGKAPQIRLEQVAVATTKAALNYAKSKNWIL